MRITLDIDDDVLAAVRELAAHEHRSLGAVLSSLARGVLPRPASASGSAAGAAGRPPGSRFAVLPQRNEVVTLEHLRQLQDAEAI